MYIALQVPLVLLGKMIGWFSQIDLIFLQFNSSGMIFWVFTWIFINFFPYLLGFPLCTSSSQCQPGFECLPIGNYLTCQPCQTSRCYTNPADSCQSALDCPPNYQCALMDETGRRACLEAAPPLPFPMPRPLSCRRDSDCPPGYYCQEDLTGVAQCQVPSSRNGCSYNRDCRNGQACVQNDQGYRRCLDPAPPLPPAPPIDPCSMSQWCQSGYLCTVDQRPMCIISNCVSTNDCPTGKSCVRIGNEQRSCLDNIEHHHRDEDGCGVDGQCRSGYSCTVKGQRYCIENPSGNEQRDQGGRWWAPCAHRYECQADLSCLTTLANRRFCAAVNAESCVSDGDCSTGQCFLERFGDVMGNCVRQSSGQRESIYYDDSRRGWNYSPYKRN